MITNARARSDDNYVSARLPGDAYTFSKTFAALLPASEGARIKAE